MEEQIQSRQADLREGTLRVLKSELVAIEEKLVAIKDKCAALKIRVDQALGDSSDQASRKSSLDSFFVQIIWFLITMIVIQSGVSLAMFYSARSVAGGIFTAVLMIPLSVLISWKIHRWEEAKVLKFAQLIVVVDTFGTLVLIAWFFGTKQYTHGPPPSQ